MAWLDRQSFLGVDSDTKLNDLTVGLVGLGGGNSHVVQQLAHLGVGGFVLVDDDEISLSNLNRLVGGTRGDVQTQASKADIATRVIRAVNPNARIDVHEARWQEVGEALKVCDVIVGGVDNVRAKDELEGFCRRFLIPYIDLGMDVHQLTEGQYLVAGQVVLSMPGKPCLRCLQVVTDLALAEESKRYGQAGSKPQVVWPNGVLASTAVGLVAHLIAPWSGKQINSAYLVYDGNLGTVTESDRLRRWVGKPCLHYPASAVGDPAFDIRKHSFAVEAEAAPFRPSILRWITDLFCIGRNWWRDKTLV